MFFGGTFSVYQSTRTRELLQQDVHKTRTAWLSGSHLGGWCIPAHLTTKDRARGSGIDEDEEAPGGQGGFSLMLVK